MESLQHLHLNSAPDQQEQVYATIYVSIHMQCDYIHKNAYTTRAQFLFPLPAYSHTHTHTHICRDTWTPCGKWVFGSQWLVSPNEKWMSLKLDKLKLDNVRETADSKIEFLGSKTPWQMEVINTEIEMSRFFWHYNNANEPTILLMNITDDSKEAL